MPLSYRSISTPAAEPVTLTQAKQHLRVDFSDDDAYITSLITAARQRIEAITNRAIFARQMVMTLDMFPFPGWGGTGATTERDYYITNYYRRLAIKLPLPSCVSVESLAYLANDGVTTITIDPSHYIVDTLSEPARISPTPGYTWPYQQNYIPGQIKVQFTTGTYGDGVTVNTCPQTIVWAMLLLIGHWYNHREAASELTLTTIPLGVAELLAGEVFDTFDL